MYLIGHNVLFHKEIEFSFFKPPLFKQLKINSAAYQVKEITSKIQTYYRKIYYTCLVNSVCNIRCHFVKFAIFLQNLPYEIIFNDWFWFLHLRTVPKWRETNSNPRSFGWRQKINLCSLVLSFVKETGRFATSAEEQI